MKIAVFIAFKHILSRKRQSLVSVMGIVIGVAFFLAISSLMQGSQKDFIERLIDNAPHITVSDDFRAAKPQPVSKVYPHGLVELRSVKPLTETRGIRGYQKILDELKATPGVRASAVLNGQALLSFAGQDVNINLNGMIPQEMREITTIEDNMIKGSVDDLAADRNGIILGQPLLDKMSLNFGDNITLAASTGQVRVFRIIGTFRTGRAEYDERQAFVDIKRVQSLLGRANRANSIIIKMDNPDDALSLSRTLERKIGYKSVSWQEATEDLLNTLVIRNIIMYSVVSAVLIVAAFGIYNIISTVVMEKHRDIAILKSIGFRAADIKRIFLIQGVVLGFAGLIAGLPLGCGLMYALMQIRFNPPGATEPVNMPLDWSVPQFVIAGAFALVAAVLAAWLPARKAAQVLPVDILRGGM